MEERNMSMTQDEMIMELITLLQKNNMNKSANEVFETAVYVDSLEKKLDAMAQELSDVRKQLVEMQEQTVMDSIKKSLTDAGQRAEVRFNEMKESFMETKQALHDKAAEIVADAKARGKAALNRVSEFFGIKPKLEKMRDKMAQSIADTTRIINKIDALGTGIRESGQNLANTFRTFADKQEVDYSQREKKFSKTDAIKKPWEAYRKSCEKFKLRLDAMIDKCENLSLDVELHKQEKSRSAEVVQSIMPMVAEKEYQYGADAFEAFQSTDKAKEMAKAISTPDRDSVKVGKGR